MPNIPLPPHMLLGKGGNNNNTKQNEGTKRPFDGGASLHSMSNKKPHMEYGTGSKPSMLNGKFN